VGMGMTKTNGEPTLQQYCRNWGARVETVRMAKSPRCTSKQLA
jgi:hypothetical protein